MGECLVGLASDWYANITSAIHHARRCIIAFYMTIPIVTFVNCAARHHGQVFYSFGPCCHCKANMPFSRFKCKPFVDAHGSPLYSTIVFKSVMSTNNALRMEAKSGTSRLYTPSYA